MADFMRQGGFDPPVTARGHASYVRDVAVHTDSNRVFSSSGDGTLRAWDVESGLCHAEMKGHRDAIRCLLMRPDAVVYSGSRITRGVIYSGSADCSARAWDMGDMSPMRLFKGHSGTVMCICATKSADQEALLFTGSADGTARAWDINSAETVRHFRGHHKEVYSIGAFPQNDPDQVFTGSRDASVIIWDFESSSPLKRLEGHQRGLLAGNGAVYCVHPSHSKCFSAAADGTVRVWEIGEGDPRAKAAREHGLELEGGFGFEFGDQVATCGGEGTSMDDFEEKESVKLCALQSHAELNGSRGTVTKILPDSRRYEVKCEHDGETRRFEAHNLRPEDSHEHWITCMHVHTKALGSVDGRGMHEWTIYTGSFDHTARKWGGQTGAPLMLFKGHSAPITAMHYAEVMGYNSEGVRTWQQLLITGEERGAKQYTDVRVWDCETGECLRILQGHKDAIQGLGFGEGVVYSGSRDGTVKFWHLMFFGAELATFGSKFLPRGLRKDLQRKHKTAQRGDGVVVLDVAPTSPAYRARLQKHDRITAFDFELSLRTKLASKESLVKDPEPDPPRPVHCVRDIIGRAGLIPGKRFEMHVVRPPTRGSKEERDGIFEELVLEFMTEESKTIVTDDS